MLTMTTEQPASKSSDDAKVRSAGPEKETRDRVRHIIEHTKQTGDDGVIQVVSKMMNSVLDKSRSPERDL
jgi:hypothetical protein